MYARLRRQLHNFLLRPRAQRCMLPVAWLLLGIGRALVLLFPFRVLSRLLGRPLGPSPASSLPSPRQTRRALEIGRTVRWAACHTPWSSNCFAQAVAAGILLRVTGIPYAVCFGLSRNQDKELAAHAWVTAGAVRVCGGNGFAGYTVVGCFISWGHER